MASRTPPLLSPYLALPPETSLLLLTSVLGASTNWLVLRYLHHFLQSQPKGYPPTNETVVENVDPETKVVLVSFLRDLSFWRDGARKLGVDLDKLGENRRFGFVDGLTGLFLPANMPVRSNGDWQTVLRTQKLEGVCKEILGMVRGMQDAEETVVLLIDGLDFFLAAGPCGCDSVGLGDMVMELRENVHSMVLAISGDDPLVKRQVTELETNHASFLLSLAHQADMTMSLRLLDTGTARDVSGVIRISVRNGMELHKGKLVPEGRELLYFVGRDGTLKIFERGQ